MNEGLAKLPRSWVWTRLGEIGFVASGGTPSTTDENNFGGDIPWVTPADLSGFKGKFISRGNRNLAKKGLKSSSAVLLPVGSLLFSSRAPIGYVAIASNPISTNQGFKNLILPKNVFNEYVFYYLKGNKRLAESLAIGTTFLEISGSKFAQVPIPLPPLPEQHRIVAKIEELFTRLDAGIEALKKIKAQLKRYRQAVLKYAFEGKLTQEWREANKGKIEPASVLLERIKEERKKETNGKFKELPPVDTSELPELPEGWVWITFSQLISPLRNSIKRGPFGSAVKKAFFVEKGFKVYEQQNAIYDNPRLGNYYINEDKFNELIGFEVKPGDFIVSCSGTIGKITQLPHNAERGIINQALLKLTIDSRLVAQKFFLECFRSDQFQTKLLKETRGSAMKNINSVEDIKIIPIALPPLVEQQKILEEIDSRL